MSIWCVGTTDGGCTAIVIHGMYHFDATNSRALVKFSLMPLKRMSSNISSMRPLWDMDNTHGSTMFVGTEIYPAPAWWKATPLSMTACSLGLPLPGKRFSSSHKALRVEPGPLPCSCRSGTSTALATSFAHSSHACTTRSCGKWCIIVFDPQN